MDNFLNRKNLIWGGVIVAVIVILFFTFKTNEIDVFNSNGGEKIKERKISSIAGLDCENKNARPFAIMISSDAEARPLSGIGEADMVFEMPVVENGFTRMMAVFQCNKPKEIGSVRSSRLDFVPLALGINAIYAHFGGEHTVLEELNAGVIDNIDGLKYDGTIYYRKKNIPMPHNAFTSWDLLTQSAKDNNYKTSDIFSGYNHSSKDKSNGTTEPPKIFNSSFAVEWRYDSNTNAYYRKRGGRTEIDKNSGEQVKTKNLAILKTTWSPISKDYIRVKTVGTGRADYYTNGSVIHGSWQKGDDKAKLMFYDQDGDEIKFSPGNIWVEIEIQL